MTLSGGGGGGAEGVSIINDELKSGYWYGSGPLESVMSADDDMIPFP